MNKINLLFIVSCYLLFSSIARCQQNATDRARHFSIQSELSYLAVADSVLSLQQAITEYNSGHFIRKDDMSVNLGIANDDYWLHCTVENNTAISSDLYLQLDNPRLNVIDMYVLKDRQTIALIHTGDLLPFRMRAEKVNNFTFPLKLNASSRQEVFILIKHQGSSLQLAVHLFDKNTFIASTQKAYLFMGLRMGLLLIVLCFGVFLYFNTRNKNFIFFSIYVFTAALWIWCTEGFGFQFTWPQSPGLNNRLEAALGVFYSAVFILNTLEFTKPYDDERNKLRKVLRVFMIMFTAWTVLPLLPFLPFTVKGPAVIFLYTFFFLNLSGAVLMSVYLLKLYRRGHPVVLYYFLAVLVTIVLSVMVALFNMGCIDLPFSCGLLMSAGIITDVVLMTLGITRQFYNYKQEREKMLVEYLEQQKSITHKILQTQEEERKRISEELHDDIGSGLTQIILMSESISRKPGMAHELGEIAITGRQLVNSIGEIIWSFNPENKSLEQLFIYMREQLNKLLEYGTAAYTIRLPDAGAGIELSAMQRRNILLVTKELVHNAVKHSKAQHIWVKASLDTTGLLSFETGDDGAGFDPEKVYSGNGLKNIRQRIADINGHLLVSSAPGKGAVFTIHYRL